VFSLLCQMEKERLAESLVFAAAFLWALFPIITKLTFNNISALHTAAFSALFAAIFFIIVKSFQNNFSDFKNKKVYKPIILTTLLNGVLYYGLIFTGLKYTTAGNVAILVLMEVFYTIFILRVWNKENLEKKQITGSCFMVLGAFLVLIQNGFSFNIGDWIIIIAVAIPPFGNYYAKQAREYVSSSTVLLFRNFFAGIILLIIASLLYPFPSIEAIENSLIFLIINGFILFGLTKMMWLEAIHRMLIGKAISLSSINPIFTILFAFLILKEIPTLGQLFGFFSVMVGIYFLTRKTKQLNHSKLIT
jgi:drug/metabolite transporter (DMT)-like permease